MVGRDMTFSVYSKQNLSIKDKDGKVNMLHYDGNEPSGFTNSDYKSSSQAWTAVGIQKEVPPLDLSMGALLGEMKSWVGSLSHLYQWVFLNI